MRVFGLRPEGHQMPEESERRERDERGQRRQDSEEGASASRPLRSAPPSKCDQSSQLSLKQVIQLHVILRLDPWRAGRDGSSLGQGEAAGTTSRIAPVRQMYRNRDSTSVPRLLSYLKSHRSVYCMLDVGIYILQFTCKTSTVDVHDREKKGVILKDLKSC